jgi:hypothetical protein
MQCDEDCLKYVCFDWRSKKDHDTVEEECCWGKEKNRLCELLNQVSIPGG